MDEAREEIVSSEPKIVKKTLVGPGNTEKEVRKVTISRRAFTTALASLLTLGGLLRDNSVLPTKAPTPTAVPTASPTVVPSVTAEVKPTTTPPNIPHTETTQPAQKIATSTAQATPAKIAEQQKAEITPSAVNAVDYRKLLENKDFIRETLSSLWLKNYHDEKEKNEAVDKTLDRVMDYKKGAFGLTENPMLDQKIEDSRKWEKDVDIAGCVVKLGLEKDFPFLASIIKSIIFIESGGDPKAENGLDKGLCQVRMTTGIAMLAKLKEEGLFEDLKKSGFLKLVHDAKTNSDIPDLFDPKTNIILSIRYLARLLRLFSDTTLAFQAYNLGEGNMISVMRAYVVANQGKLNPPLSVKEMDTVLQNPLEPGSAELVKKLSLNVTKLFSCPKVFEELALNRVNPETQYYTYKAMAADCIFAAKP